MTLTDTDISTRQFWAQEPRQRDLAFAELRAAPQLTFHPTIELGATEGGPGFWAAARHADIIYISRHADLFCSGKGVGFSDIPPEYNEVFGSFLMTDAPRHTHLRGLISRAFTPRQIGLIDDQIRNQAHQLVAEAVALGDCDLVRDLSQRLPLWTISEMLGVPEHRRDEFRDASNLMVGASDAKEAAQHGSGLDKLIAATMMATEIGVECAVARRDDPRDDLFTALVQADVDGHRLTDQEIGSFTVLLGVAGNDTTRNSISHGVIAFADNPDQWDLLRSDPERYIPGAVEEILRWASPVLTFRRTATTDTTIGDQAIAEGDHVVMFYASANRDEQVFDDPWRFDITRHPNHHLAFGGGGPHYCLGANLARSQLRSVFTELAARVSGFEVGRPDHVLSAFVNGIRSLPCRFVTD